MRHSHSLAFRIMVGLLYTLSLGGPVAALLYVLFRLWTLA
jgi:hypothetical protein